MTEKKKLRIRKIIESVQPPSRKDARNEYPCVVVGTNYTRFRSIGPFVRMHTGNSPGTTYVFIQTGRQTTHELVQVSSRLGTENVVRGQSRTYTEKMEPKGASKVQAKSRSRRRSLRIRSVSGKFVGTKGELTRAHGVRINAPERTTNSRIFEKPAVGQLTQLSSISCFGRPIDQRDLKQRPGFSEQLGWELINRMRIGLIKKRRVAGLLSQQDQENLDALNLVADMMLEEKAPISNLQIELFRKQLGLGD